MKQVYALIAGILLACSTIVAQEKVINDPYATARITDPFTAVEVSGGIDLYISQSAENAVALSASEEKLIGRIKTEVKNGVLKIYADNSVKMWGGNGKRLKAYIAAPVLHRISASGASDVYITGVLKQEDLEINLSGACDLKGTIDVENLSLQQSGSSDSRLSGKARYSKLEVSGASDIKAYDLETEFCKAAASGASDIQILVTKEITATASGASDIYYKGNASAKEIKQSGASTVARRS